MNYAATKIKLDAEHGVVTCRMRSNNNYDLLRFDGTALYEDVPETVVSFFIRSEESTAFNERLLADARALGQPYIVAYGGDTYSDFLRDNTPTGFVNIEKLGFEKAKRWFAARNFVLTENEPWLNDPNRKERNSRDYCWQPWIRFPFIHGKAYPFPVVCAGTIGKGRKFKKPIFILAEDGFITCTYQEFLEGLLKAGWQFVAWKGAALERLFANTTTGARGCQPLLFGMTRDGKTVYFTGEQQT